MKHISITFLLLMYVGLCHGQIYKRNERRYVFSDGVNVREQASLKAKVLGSLKQGTEVIVCAKQHIKDIVNGVEANWIPILYNGGSAYIWGNTIATGAVLHSNGNLLLLKNDAKGLSYKLFEKGELKGEGAYADVPYEIYSYIKKVTPLTTEKGLIYFKLGASTSMYAFDGMQVRPAGKSKRDEGFDLHESATDTLPKPKGLLVNGEKVNLRSEPNTGAKVLASLPKYSTAEEIERLEKRETINGEENNWYKVKWQGKTGYVWGKFVSKPLQHIYDNDDRNTTYLLCHNALFVLKGGKIVGEKVFNFSFYDQTLHSFGDLGFGKEYDFVAIESMAESCGEWGGDNYYLWDGKKLKHFCADGGVGDGGFSESESYVFPSYSNGIQGKVIRNSSAGESIEILPANDCEEHFDYATDYDITSILYHDGDSLRDAPSKHLNLQQFLQKQFPSYELKQYEFSDINADSLEDVVFRVQKTKPVLGEDGKPTYNNAYTNKIGIAFGTHDGQWASIKVNGHLVEESDYNTSEITINGSTILITTYFPTQREEYSESLVYERKMYEFIYESGNGGIYWNSITTIDKNGLNKSSFKAKKILFEGAWNFSRE
jgi:uncharacterized protein YgiM (DUF1202 family)